MDDPRPPPLQKKKTMGLRLKDIDLIFEESPSVLATVKYARNWSQHSDEEVIAKKEKVEHAEKVLGTPGGPRGKTPMYIRISSASPAYSSHSTIECIRARPMWDRAGINNPESDRGVYHSNQPNSVSYRAAKIMRLHSFELVFLREFSLARGPRQLDIVNPPLSYKTKWVHTRHPEEVNKNVLANAKSATAIHPRI